MLKSVPIYSTISGNLTNPSSNLALSWKDNHHPKVSLGLKLVIIITANCLFNEPFFLALEQFLYNPTFDICNSRVCEVCKHIWSGNCTYTVCTCYSEFTYPRFVIDHNSILLVWLDDLCVYKVSLLLCFLCIQFNLFIKSTSATGLRYMFYRSLQKRIFFVSIQKMKRS